MLMNLQSAEADEPTGKLNFKLKFWQDVAPVECLKAHIKKVVFKNFRGERSELVFLRFVLERAQILQTLVVVLTDGDGDHASQEELGNRLKPLIYSTHRASKCAEFFIFVRCGGTSWSFRTASDLSRNDPFDC